MLKIAVISKCALQILSIHSMIYVRYFLKKKSKFSFYFSVKGKKLNIFPGHFSLILFSLACLGGIILGVNLENGL